MDRSSFKQPKHLLRVGLCSTLVVIAFSCPAWAGSVYLCKFDELMICGEGLGCSDASKDKVGIPRDVSIDVAKGQVSGLDDAQNLREATAENVEQSDGVYFFQAIERSRPNATNIVGWTVSLDTTAMKISGSAVDGGIVFNLFGRCDLQNN